jgi:serine protease
MGGVLAAVGLVIAVSGPVAATPNPPGPVVAVLDTGITAHPALGWSIDPAGRGIPRGRTRPGYDFISDPWKAADGDGWDPDPSDPGDGVRDSEGNGTCTNRRSSWHGTNVIGTVVDIAPTARILPVRIMGRCGGNTGDVAAALLWAVGEQVPGIPLNPTPANIVNLSMSGASPKCSLALQTAIDTAVARGSLIVAAAGSTGADTARQTPANCTNVIVVGSVNRDALRTPTSGFGEEVTFSALGGDMTVRAANGVLTTTNKGRYEPGKPGYGFYQSSSAATARVSGAAALLARAYPSDSPAQLRDRLTGFLVPFPPGACDQGEGRCGDGILDLGALRSSIGT